ncbi:MAG: arylesterase [Desulfuromonadales bacterium]|nr:arylesterase [Desulfuromonadales bacterium]MBN2790869.1 arylesterase [Desulfuromonadales bacterium]
MKIFTTLCCSLVLFALVACDSDPQKISTLRPNDVILAFGDSLTLGVGTEPGLGYPEQLYRLTARQVVNAGVSGETSADGARRLPALLDQYEPEVVIICHGGNDLLRKLDRQTLRANLRNMFEAANQRKIAVVMIAVPQPDLLMNDAPLYRELADELNFLLLEKSLGELLRNPQYKSDAVHLNAQGYRKLAEAVADLLYENGAL